MAWTLAPPQMNLCLCGPGSGFCLALASPQGIFISVDTQNLQQATGRKVSSRKMKFHCKGDMLRGRVSHVAADWPDTLCKTFGPQVKTFLFETRNSIVRATCYMDVFLVWWQMAKVLAKTVPGCLSVCVDLLPGWPGHLHPPNKLSSLWACFKTSP